MGIQLGKFIQRLDPILRCKPDISHFDDWQNDAWASFNSILVKRYKETIILPEVPSFEKYQRTLLNY